MHSLNFGSKPPVDKAHGSPWIGVLDVGIKGFLTRMHAELILKVPNFLAYVIYGAFKLLADFADA